MAISLCGQTPVRRRLGPFEVRCSTSVRAAPSPCSTFSAERGLEIVPGHDLAARAVEAHLVKLQFGVTTEDRVLAEGVT